MRLASLVDDYLFVWVLAAAGVGLLVPRTAVVTAFSTPILAAMVGSVSLTLSVDRFRSVSRGGMAAILLGHVAMPFLGFGLARALSLPPAPTAGFVLLGAVTPELVAPTMTELAGGDTALTSAALVVVGVGSTAFVPGAVALLLGRVSVRTGAIVEQLVAAVVIPMTVAVAARTRYPETVSRYDRYYPTVSALAVVLIICGVTAANAELLRSGGSLVAVAVGAAALNAAGYAIGWVTTAGRSRPTRVAATLSVGTRDFAVAAALVVAAGFPPAAALPAVVFGVVEMATSAGAARYLGRSE